MTSLPADRQTHEFLIARASKGPKPSFFLGFLASRNPKIPRRGGQDSETPPVRGVRVRADPWIDARMRRRDTQEAFSTCPENKNLSRRHGEDSTDSTDSQTAHTKASCKSA
jgi:hypothetical protein